MQLFKSHVRRNVSKSGVRHHISKSSARHNFPIFEMLRLTQCFEITRQAQCFKIRRQVQHFKIFRQTQFSVTMRQTCFMSGIVYIRELVPHSNSEKLICIIPDLKMSAELKGLIYKNLQNAAKGGMAPRQIIPTAVICCP